MEFSSNKHILYIYTCTFAYVCRLRTTGERRRSSKAARPFRRALSRVRGWEGEGDDPPFRRPSRSAYKIIPARYRVMMSSIIRTPGGGGHRGSVSKRTGRENSEYPNALLCVLSACICAAGHYRRSFYFIIILHAFAGGSRRAFIGLAFTLLSVPGRDFVHDILRYGYGIVVVVRTPVPE